MYGYWINKDGMLVEVEEYLGHRQVIPYEDAFEHSLIALVTMNCPNELFVRFYKLPSVKLLNKLQSFILNEKPNRIIYDLTEEISWWDSKNFHAQHSEPKQFLRMLNNLKELSRDYDPEDDWLSDHLKSKKWSFQQ